MGFYHYWTGNMISHIYVYDNCDENQVPYKNIAVEEYLMRHVPEDAVTLFLWKNKKTVVIGRNQNAWRECQVEKLAADGGYLARRLSGGGAVYHNTGNLNFTFCAPRDSYDVSRQVSVIAEAAKSFGIHAEKTGRNDIMADGRKFSGNAFYKSADRAYHHGTILISEDMAHMVKYLDTSGSKLHAKSVKSVPARVVNLHDLSPLVTVDSFRTAMKAAFEKVYGLPAEYIRDEDLDWQEIGEREKFFASYEWRLGRQQEFTNQWEDHFDWGFLRLYVKVQDGIIREAQVDSDGLAATLISKIPEALRGCPYETKEIQSRILSLPAETEEERTVLTDAAGMIRS